MRSDVLNQLAVASALPFLVILVASLTFYFGNVNEIIFSLSKIVFPANGVF